MGVLEVLDPLNLASVLPLKAFSKKCRTSKEGSIEAQFIIGDQLKF